jgi:hypothetical protein
MHAASALVCVSRLIQDKNMPVYTRFELSLERDPISARCSWKRHSKEHSTEDMVLLGAVLCILPNSTSGSAGLGGRKHLMKRSETRPVMKMVMISRRGDGGGK